MILKKNFKNIDVMEAVAVHLFIIFGGTVFLLLYQTYNTKITSRKLSSTNCHGEN